MHTAKRIGILTGGGDCPGLNAVIRAVATTAASYGFATIGFSDGFEGLYTKQYKQIECADVLEILPIGGTILGTTNRGHFGLPLSQEVLDKSLETYKELDLVCVICIGGDGTMSIAYRLSQVGINVVGVPKTIDNDLMSTDQTFGFDSAVHVVTEALDRLHTTAASHHRVMVVEVMGRNAGWIALHSGVAGGASVILLPEVDWTWESIIPRIKQHLAVNKNHYCIVVIAEGAKIPGKAQVSLEVDKNGNTLRLGGIGNVVAEEITNRTGLETRTTVLGHVQRGGSPTCYDRILGTKFGSVAAKLACEGDYGKMVSLRGTEMVAVEITSNVEKQRTIDVSTNQLVWAAKKIGVTFGDS